MRRGTCRTAAALLILFFGIGATNLAEAKPALRVVVTIKPIQSLVADVMKGVGQPTLLLPPNASPHAYAMRPSKAETLRRADIVFWVGPELESFLRGFVSTLNNAQIVTLSKEAGLRRLRVRQSGVWANSRHEPDDHDGADGHRHGETDPHLWLDPKNAIAIAQIAARELSAADPANAGLYKANADRLTKSLNQLDVELRNILTPVASRPFIVFHDAYQYLETRYGLTAVGSLSLSPERKPGARRMVTIRRLIEQRRVRCAFGEPQFSRALIRSVTRGTSAKSAVLDPLGVNAVTGPGGYAQTLKTMAQNIAYCLERAARPKKERTNKHNLL